jgi:hypothetical protein
VKGGEEMQKKKIGIITLSASDNCGSLLQSYALKQLMSKYGDVEIINFSSEQSHKIYDVFPKSMDYRKKLERLPYKERLFTEKEDYNFFRHEYLQISGREYFSENLSMLNGSYDVVVVGSDQVWNVCMGDFDNAFFLGWTKARKIAYAPSLGGHDIRESKFYEKVWDWLNDFSAISVREEFGKRCLEEILNNTIEKVLDPTLVLSDEIWRELIHEPLIKGDYIFYYSWAYADKWTSKIVSEEGKRLGVPVIVMDTRKWIGKSVEKWNFILNPESGPLVFLNLMYYAKKCYVESFHGMIFSYIYKKNFWLLDIHENYDDIDTRLAELLELLGVKHRVLTRYNVDKINQDESIEYGENKRLKRERNLSKLFLEKAIKGVQNEVCLFDYGT